MAWGKKTGGRTKGTPNKISKAKKLFLEEFIERNEPRLQELWESAVARSPTEALKLYFAAAEFCRPRLGRLEHVGEGGGPMAFVLEVRKES